MRGSALERHSTVDLAHGSSSLSRARDSKSKKFIRRIVIRLMHWRRHGRVVVLFFLLLGFFWLLLGRTYPYRDLDLDRPASASHERLRGTPRSAAGLPAARVNALRASYLQLLKQDNACISLAQTQQPNAQTEWQLHDLEVQNQSADLDTWNELHGDEPPVQTIWQRVDIKELKHAVANLPTNAWTRIGQERTNAVFLGRAVHMNHSKPGVESIHLIMSDNAAHNVYVFPWWWDENVSPFRKLVMRVLCEVMAPLGYGANTERHLLRVQLARMAPHSAINMHQDSGRWAEDAHRLHVPLIVPKEANGDGHYYFEVRIPNNSKSMKKGKRMVNAYLRNITVDEGLVFELNNVLAHRLSVGKDERVHLLVDFLENPLPPKRIVVLDRAQRCMYGKKDKLLFSRKQYGVDCSRNHTMVDEVKYELTTKDVTPQEVMDIIYGDEAESHMKQLIHDAPELFELSQ